MRTESGGESLPRERRIVEQGWRLLSTFLSKRRMATKRSPGLQARSSSRTSSGERSRVTPCTVTWQRTAAAGETTPVETSKSPRRWREARRAATEADTDCTRTAGGRKTTRMSARSERKNPAVEKRASSFWAGRRRSGESSLTAKKVTWPPGSAAATEASGGRIGRGPTAEGAAWREREGGTEGGEEVEEGGAARFRESGGAEEAGEAASMGPGGRDRVGTVSKHTGEEGGERQVVGAVIGERGGRRATHVWRGGPTRTRLTNKAYRTKAHSDRSYHAAGALRRKR